MSLTPGKRPSSPCTSAAGRLERLHVVARDPNVDLATGRTGRALEDRHGLQPRHGAHSLAPFLDQRLRAYGAPIGGLQLDPHGTHVVAGAEEKAVGTGRRLADLAEAHDHEATGAACQRALGLVQRPPELVHHGGRGLSLGALDEGDVGEHRIRFRRREEDEGDAPAPDQPYEQQQETDRDRDGQVSPGDAAPHDAGEQPVAEGLEARVEPSREPVFPARIGLQTDTQMTGQHHEALDQARDEHGHDHQGNGPRWISPIWPDTMNSGRKAAMVVSVAAITGASIRRAPSSAASAGPAPRGALGHGMLADHDGVVHDDADRHNEREQAHHVDGLAGQHHHAEGREQRDGDADRDPEGDPRAQEDEQHQHHQSQPARAVAEQHADAVVDQLRRIVVVLDNQGRWQRRPHLLEKGIEDARLLQRIGTSSPAAPASRWRGSRP